MIKQIIFKLIRIFIGKNKNQFFFEKLLTFCHFGMNIQYSTDSKKNGELNCIKYIKDYFQKKYTVNSKLILFDVGANIGKYSFLLNEVFSDKANIHAFEPSKTAFFKLKNRFINLKNFTPHQLGAGNKLEKRSLYYEQEGSELGSLFKRDLKYTNLNFNKKEEIQIITLDSFCKKKGIDCINFLKLDVEGNELNVLAGAQKLIQFKKIDFIQFEFGYPNIDSRTYFKDIFFFLDKNYSIYRIMVDGLYPIREYNEKYEIFRNTNFLAQKK